MQAMSRRKFLKLSGGAAASISLLPQGLLASDTKKEDYSEQMKRLMDYDVGVRTPNYCEMCFWNCGVNVYTRKGRIHKIEGNKLNPNNYGTICAKGNAGIASTYDPDRLKYPLLRTGKRGEGKWKRISWDEAYEYIYQKLNKIIQEHGARSIAGFAHGSCGKYFHKFINVLGSPNITYASFSECRGSRAIGFNLTYGGGGIGGHETYDMRNTKYMIVFGRNFSGAIQVREARDFIEGISRGAKLVYVDPRQSESNVKAHRWLQINAGCDLALALGLIHVIIRDDLANMEFVNKYCYGFNELAKHVQQYTPQWAEKITGIKAEAIEEVAWEFAKNAPHVLAMTARRISRYANDAQSARAVAILNALMGNYGVKGGFWVPQKYPIKLPKDEPVPSLKDVLRADGVGTTYPFSPPNLGLSSMVYKATLTKKPYPIKAWLLYDTNTLGHTAVEANKIFEAMENLDLIMCVDTQLNDSAYYADIVLPESTYLEKDDGPYMQKDEIPFITIRRAAIKPLYDTKHIFDIAKGILAKFDLDTYFGISPKDAINNLYNALSKEDKEKLDKEGIIRDETADAYPQASGKPLHFSTSTGKIQLYCPDLEARFKEYGDVCSPLPTFVSPPMPKGDELRLLFGRGPAHAHARTQNNWMLLELADSTPIWIHPNDAKKRGFKEGDSAIMINTKTGLKSIPQILKITKRIKEGNVFIHHGFGHISKAWTLGYNKGISDVYFCSNDVDPVSGCTGLNNGFIKLERA